MSMMSEIHATVGSIAKSYLPESEAPGWVNKFLAELSECVACGGGVGTEVCPLCEHQLLMDEDEYLTYIEDSARAALRYQAVAA